MLFNSLEFAFFFILVFFIYFLIKPKWQIKFLLISSYIFYGSWDYRFLSLIMISTILDFICGIKIYESKKHKIRKYFLILSITGNLTILGFFKYFNFFIENIQNLLNLFNISINTFSLNIILPIGISFYTFQTMSYTIDIYRKQMNPTKKFTNFALFVCFFPQLVAGPIERAKKLLPQFSKEHNFDHDRVCDGFKLVLWGLFKKMVIADNLAKLVNPIYSNISQYQNISIIIATIFFAFQIYCDFSGYSDIAIGLAQILGYKLMDNFNRPYFSKSIAEFWKRWHISLSTWFQDYCYIPLGGNRVSKKRWQINIMIVFLISGLWHGANWTFLFWGFLHGFYLILSHLSYNLRKKITRNLKLTEYPIIHKYLKIFITFTLVCFSWIFFRAKNLTDAIHAVLNLFKGWNNIHQEISIFWNNFKIEFTLGLLFILFLEFIHLIQRHQGIRTMLKDKPIWFRYLIYYSLIILILLFCDLKNNDFIYFQF